MMFPHVSHAHLFLVMQVPRLEGEIDKLKEQIATLKVEKADAEKKLKDTKSKVKLSHPVLKSCVELCDFFKPTLICFSRLHI